MELREEIADVIELRCDDRQEALRLADRILAIPEIKEMMEAKASLDRVFPDGWADGSPNAPPPIEHLPNR